MQKLPDIPATVTGKDGKVYPTSKPRREIWEAMRPNSGNSVPTNAGRPKEFAGDTAAAAGMTKRAINEHLARAEALGEDLDEIAGTSLDKGVELDALKDLPQEERKELIQRAKAIKRRKEIWEAMRPQQVGQVVPPVSKHGHAQPHEFAADTSRASGESKRDVNRHLARAEAPGEDLDEVAGANATPDDTRRR